MGYLGDFEAELGLVLGSGLGVLVDVMHVEAEIGFGEIRGFAESTVPGHRGRFLFGTIGHVPVVVAQGRVHLYEGYGAKKVCKPVDFFAQCGVKTLVLTNAAGSLNPAFEPGRWMMLADHLNLTGKSPLTGGAHFVDMSEVYAEGLRERFRGVAAEREIALYEGVYAGVVGPQYETPAEVRMLRGLGADAVGMSTVLEAVRARALGMEVAGFSCLTNWGAGLGGGGKLDHDEVVAMGDAAADELIELLAGVFEFCEETVAGVGGDDGAAAG